MYMNQGDTVQIEAPDFDLHIGEVTSLSTNQKPNEVTLQGTLPPILEVTEPEDNDSLTPGLTTQQLTSQETDWLDAIPMQTHEFLHPQSSQKSKDTTEAKPDITQIILKFLN